MPSMVEGGAVPARVAAKLALDEEVRAAGLTKTGLARRLGVPDTEARRLLDLDHPTKMDRLERVLASFGVELVVTTREPAASAPGDLADAARRTTLD